MWRRAPRIRSVRPDGTSSQLAETFLERRLHRHNPLAFVVVATPRFSSRQFFYSSTNR
jgi:hypothetical protein